MSDETTVPVLMTATVRWLIDVPLEEIHARFGEDMTVEKFTEMFPDMANETEGFGHTLYDLVKDKPAHHCWDGYLDGEVYDPDDWPYAGWHGPALDYRKLNDA